MFLLMFTTGMFHFKLRRTSTIKTLNREIPAVDSFLIVYEYL